MMITVHTTDTFCTCPACQAARIAERDAWEAEMFSLTGETTEQREARIADEMDGLNADAWL